MKSLIVDLSDYPRYVHRRLEAILEDWRRNRESAGLLYLRLCELGLNDFDARLIAYGTAQALKA